MARRPSTLLKIYVIFHLLAMMTVIVTDGLYKWLPRAVPPGQVEGSSR